MSGFHYQRIVKELPGTDWAQKARAALNSKRAGRCQSWMVLIFVGTFGLKSLEPE